MENSKFIIFCIVDSLLVILLIALIIGMTVADHMRAVRRESRSAYDERMAKATAKTDADYNATKNAATEEALAAQRRAELDNLNKKLVEETDKGLKEQEAIKADALKAANVAIVVAPSTEKYVTDPHLKSKFYNDNETRATQGVDPFMEQFTKLTKDGVKYNRYDDDQ